MTIGVSPYRNWNGTPNAVVAGSNPATPVKPYDKKQSFMARKEVLWQESPLTLSL